MSLEAEAQVAHDLHAALGVEWGQDPYARIKELLRKEATLKDAIRLRPVVLKFATAMEDRLLKNEWKGHWGRCTGSYLFNRLRGEVNELSRSKSADRLYEAADVANFAMMIADNAE